MFEGSYGNEVITHCCLEPHGLVAEWENDNNLLVHQSTQSGFGQRRPVRANLGIPASNVRIKMEHIGGGFGSKFPVDSWGIEAAKLSKMAGGKPVKIMLERDAELMVAGTRPSLRKSQSRREERRHDPGLGVANLGQWRRRQLQRRQFAPLHLQSRRRKQERDLSVIGTNTGPQRAWRAPNHPQACLITMARSKIWQPN